MFGGIRVFQYRVKCGNDRDAEATQKCEDVAPRRSAEKNRKLIINIKR